MQKITEQRVYPHQIQMDVTIKDIYDNVRLAREKAMLGSYESAEVYYEGSLQMIRRLLVMVQEPLRKGKWQDVSHSLKLMLR